jgi:hypothetical protein
VDETANAAGGVCGIWADVIFSNRGCSARQHGCRVVCTSGGDIVTDRNGRSIVRAQTIRGIGGCSPVTPVMVRMPSIATFANDISVAQEHCNG